MMETIQHIETLNDLDSIWAEFTPLANALGFDFVIYTISNNNSDAFYYHDNFGLHPKDEADFYDPFLEFCCHSYDTMFVAQEFLDLHVDLNMPPEAYALIERGAGLGMISGIAIPLRLAGSNRYGGFNLGSGLKREAFKRLCEKSLGSAQVACMLVHRHIEKVLDQQNILMEQPVNPIQVEAPEVARLKDLTSREMDILSAISNGHSRKQCAEALFLSESTVSSHMKSIYRKLGVHNKVQATNVLLQNG